MATDTSTSRVISTPRTAAATGIIRMPIWLCVVQIVLAYEWIISGLNKLLAPSFEAGLPQQIKQGVKGNPYQWYATFSQYGADGFATDETLVYYPGATRQRGARARPTAWRPTTLSCATIWRAWAHIALHRCAAPGG